MNPTEQQHNSGQSSLNTTMFDGGRTSLVDAMNRLKETEDRIYEAKKKLEIIQMKQISSQKRLTQKSKAEIYHNSTRSFIQAQKRLKKQHMMRRSMEINKIHEKSVDYRNTHKEKIKQIKQQIHESNRARYLELKKESEENRKAISEAKNSRISEKKAKHGILVEQQKQRKRYYQEYMRRKELEALLKKQEDTHIVQSRILEGQKLIEDLQQLTLKASQKSINPEQRSGSSQGTSLIKNFEKKNFRVKYYKNQICVQLE